MRTLSGLVLALLLLATGPGWAQPADEGSGSGQGDSGEGGDKGGDDSSKDKLKDPWSAPTVADDPEPAPADDPAGQVVVPDGYPEAEIDRPFALAPLVLEPRLDFILDFINIRGVDNQFALRFGVGFGIVEDLEAGAAFPLMFSPRTRAGDLQIYGLYDLSSLLKDVVTLAGRLQFIIPLSDRYSYYGGDFLMLLDVPVKYKIIDMLAVTGALGLGFGLYPGDDAFLLFFDLGVLFQPLSALAIEWTIGAHLFAGRDVELVPMHLKGQYTIVGDLDIWIDLAFLDLNDLGADWFQFLVGAAFRFGF